MAENIAKWQGTLISDAKALLGEGVAWDERNQCVYWIDIEGKAIHRFDPKTKASKVAKVPERIGCLVMKETGGFLAGLESGVYAVNESLDVFEKVLSMSEELPGNRSNDGKCGPDGRFYIGTMAIEQGNAEAVGAGKFYRVEKDYTYDMLMPEVTISNGLAFDVAKAKMYYIDTVTQQVVSFDWDAQTGGLSNKQVVIEVDQQEGSPDGMTIDQEGMLWVAMWGGSQVVRYNPVTGAKIGSIAIPTPFVTCPTFGGENMDELFITTASVALNANENKAGAGGLYWVKLDVKGWPVERFQ